jgi:hypothetical protein
MSPLTTWRTAKTRKIRMTAIVEIGNIHLMVHKKPFITTDYPELDREAHLRRIINHSNGQAEQPTGDRGLENRNEL